MRKVVRVSLLMMVLACSARAGVIPNGVTDAPPPPPTVTATAASETVTGIALNLINSVLSLF